jgi:hypothetical protein
MSRSIKFTTVITIRDCDSVTLEDVRESINKTTGIYLHHIDKTVDADVDLVDLVEEE